jgi:predicted alpha/beta hydrolase family esterase
MPCKQNAKYEEWKIVFEKYLSLLDKEIIVIGHSLGGIFIAKYLSENNIATTVQALYLIAAPHSKNELGESLGDFLLEKDMDVISKHCENVFLVHSEDDPVVPIAHISKRNPFSRNNSI